MGMEKIKGLIRAKYKRYVSGGVIGFIGFMLSPLSFWNDLYENVPLAYAMAWVVKVRVHDCRPIEDYF